MKQCLLKKPTKNNEIISGACHLVAYYRDYNPGTLPIFKSSHCIPLVYLICKCLQLINSLSPGRCSCTFNYVNFNQIEVWCLEQSSKHYQGWMPEDLADGKSTLIRVMAWCPQALTITQISVNQDFWCCMLPLGHNDLISRYTSFVA